MVNGWYYRARERLWLSWNTGFMDKLQITRLYCSGEKWPYALLFWRSKVSSVPFYDDDEVIEMSKLIKDLIKQRKAETGVTIEADDPWLEAIAPRVHELLTVAIRDGGCDYTPAGLFVYAAQGSWHVSLSNRKLKFRRRGEGQTIEEAFRDLENRLNVEYEGRRTPTQRNNRVADNGDKRP